MEDNKSFEELEKDFTAIRDENRKCANTAFRIGSALLSLLALSKKTLLQNKEFSDSVTFLKGIVAKAVSYFQGIVNKGEIKNTGDITNTGNINNTGNISNAGNITTKNLTVTDKATFFELEIQKAKAAGGMSVNSAGTFHIDAVVETEDGFVCYQRAEKDGVTLLQTCEPKDQMMCSNGMNILEGGKGNHFYWRKVTEAPKEVVTHTIDGKEEKCLKIVLSKTDHSENTVDIPKVGDDLVQMGNPDNKERQSIIMTCAYNSFDGDLKAPYWVQYSGVNDYKLSTHKRTWFAANGSNVTGNFKVQSDNGELESIEDYVRGLVTNTVVWHVAFSIRNITGKKGETFRLKYGRTVGESTSWYDDNSTHHGFDQLYAVIIDGATGNERQAEEGLDLKVADFFTGSSMTVRLMNNKTGELLAQDTIYPEAKQGKVGQDAVVFRLIPKVEKAVVNGAKREKAKVVLFLKYMITRQEGEKHYVELGRLDSFGLSLSIEPSWTSFEVKWEDGKPYWAIETTYDYDNCFDDTPFFRVCLMQGGKVLDARTIGLQYEVEANFNVGKRVDGLDGKIDGISGTVKTLDGRVSGFETTIDHFSTEVKDKVSHSELKQTADGIAMKVGSSVNANLLWGSDLDLSQVQDVINMAYGLGDIIKKKTEEKVEWKRSRDNASSDDDRMRYQEGMDACDRKIAQAQGEVAKCREAIAKRLGVVISGDMGIGNKEMFEFQKGKGVNCSDAIRFKNAYKRENWAKWTNISWHDVPLKPNTKYTISVWVKFKSYGKKGRMYVDCNSDDGRYCFGGFLYKEHYYSRESIDEWQRVRYVFDSGASKKMSVLNFCCIADEEEGAQCELWLCRPKLEEGNTATPWCAYDGTVEALLESGLDIKNRKMIATADNFVVQNNKGEKTFMVDKNGKINNGMLSLDGLDAKRAVIKRLRFQSNSVAPYFVTEESMKEFAAYCTRYYAGYGAKPLLPFDVVMFFVFLIKPKWLTNIDQGYNRDFSPRSRDIAVSKGMARSFQVDYFSFALELFWHNMVGKTVTIANATNENISFGVKLKTEVLDDMGKKVTQIGGRLDNLPNFPERCVERINLLPGQMASFKYTVFSGAPMNVSVREVHTKGFFLLQDLFDFSYYKKLFEVGYDTEQGFNIFDKKYIDLFNTDKEHVEPKGGFPKKKR